MLLAPEDARRFMATYEQVAIAVHAVRNESPPENPTRVLVAARERLQTHPQLLDQAVNFLSKRSVETDVAVIKALREMRLAEWVHLKDLRSGAILIDLKGSEAYCVAGLTQQPAEIIGKQGCLVETALCPFEDRILCDGIFIERGQLGPNLRRSFNERYRRLKAAGRLHRHPATAPLWRTDRSGP